MTRVELTKGFFINLAKHWCLVLLDHFTADGSLLLLLLLMLLRSMLLLPISARANIKLYSTPSCSLLHLQAPVARAAAGTACHTANTTAELSKQPGSQLQPQQPAAAVGQLLSLLPTAMVGLPPLTLEETLQAVAIPPIERNLGARVEHIYVSQPGLLSQAVESALGLPHSFVLELIRFGAVHWCPVMPQPSPKVGYRVAYPAWHGCVHTAVMGPPAPTRC